MSDRIDTAVERAKLAGLTGHTPGPWWTPGKYSGHQMGCSIIASNPNAGPAPGNPTRGQVAFATAILNTDARRCEGNARLIAAAPNLLATVHRLLDALDAERARAEKAEAERDQAIKALSKAAEARGRAEGKLAASELPGIIDGWKARAEKSEAALQRVVDEAAAAITDLQAENQRLRATLSAITATDCYSRDECTAMARAALNGEAG